MTFTTAGIHIAILLFFVMVYRFFPGGFENHFDTNKQANWIDCLYFGVSTHSTVGYGDIAPKTPIARLVVITHIIVVFMIVLML